VGSKYPRSLLTIIASDGSVDQWPSSTGGHLLLVERGNFA
jgi:hypothetical protein